MPDPASLTTVRLERPVHGGLTIGRLADGRVILVAGGLPDELVSVSTQERKGVVFGEVVSVLEPSTARVEASEHPGLDLAHAAYPLQLEIKRAVVVDAVARALKRDVEVPAVVASPQIWGYRSVVQPAVHAGGLGYRRPQSRGVVHLDRDPVATAGVRAAWDVIAPRIAADALTYKTVVEIVIRANEAGAALVTLVATAHPRKLMDEAHALVDAGIAGVAHAAYDERGRFRSGFERLAGARAIEVRYGQVELTVAHGSFAQPNIAAAARLFADLASLAGSGGHAVDLYAGGGPIAMHLAPNFTRVIAFELDRSAMTHGSHDAERQGLDNVAFVRGDAKRQALPADAELIVVDPPRSGLAREVRDKILDSAVGRLVYVSCEVSTWARDVADFEARGFSLVSVAPHDFYPHTHHVELLSLLAR